MSRLNVAGKVLNVAGKVSQEAIDDAISSIMGSIRNEAVKMVSNYAGADATHRNTKYSLRMSGRGRALISEDTDILRKRVQAELQLRLLPFLTATVED